MGLALTGVALRTWLPLAAMLIAVAAPCQADILFRYSGKEIFGGQFGPIAEAQARIRAGLQACGKPGIGADGKFGPGTRAGLVALAQCPAYAEALAGDADGRAGALTDVWWRLLMTTPAPNADVRAHALMLTYEATDYTHMQWNFCQSKPVYDPAAGRTECWSNDPHSYVTWGPNGATAGGGREVQLVLQAAEARAPGLIDTAFGAEAAAVRRMFLLTDKAPGRALETYLCGVWADPARRTAWTKGFATAGSLADVRATFDTLYKSASLDGGKIATFYRAYADNGLVPTEIDYAFFKDRSAQTTPNSAKLKAAIAAVLTADASAPRWRVRQAIALNVRPPSQREDRLGRDVAFYIDGAADSLSAEEQTAWQKRGRLRASDAGLSDARVLAVYTPGPVIDTRITAPSTLTEAEAAACPAAVLATKRPG